MSAYGGRSYSSVSLTDRFPFRGEHYSKGEAVHATPGNQLQKPEVRASARTKPTVRREVRLASLPMSAIGDYPEESQVAARSLTSTDRSNCTVQRAQLHLVELLRDPSGPEARLEPIKPLIEYLAFLFVADPKIEVACPEIHTLSHSVVYNRG